MARRKLSVLLVLRCLSLALEILRARATGIRVLVGDDGDEEELAVTVAVAGEADAGSTAALRFMRSMGLRLLQKEQHECVSCLLLRCHPVIQVALFGRQDLMLSTMGRDRRTTL